MFVFDTSLVIGDDGAGAELVTSVGIFTHSFRDKKAFDAELERPVAGDLDETFLVNFLLSLPIMYS